MTTPAPARPDPVPSHWRKGGPIPLAGDTSEASQREAAAGPPMADKKAHPSPALGGPPAADTDRHARRDAPLSVPAFWPPRSTTPRNLHQVRFNWFEVSSLLRREGGAWPVDGPGRRPPRGGRLGRVRPGSRRRGNHWPTAGCSRRWSVSTPRSQPRSRCRSCMPSGRPRCRTRSAAPTTPRWPPPSPLFEGAASYLRRCGSPAPAWRYKATALADGRVACESIWCQRCRTCWCDLVTITMIVQGLTGRSHPGGVLDLTRR